MSDWKDWIGREETRVDVLDRTRSDALTVALGGSPDASDAMPNLHHWLYFWDVRRPDQLGPDGHPLKGGFLPPVSLPRRMWAGGRLRFHAPLRFGETVQRRSVIRSVEHKSGRSGDLVFVTVSHELTGGQGVAVEEIQDLVYRPAATSPAPRAAAEADLPTPDWSHGVVADAVLLFRYSALTMNGHRIHYDLAYAQSEEHYPGLVVHGPMQATLMLAGAEARAGKRASAFTFRGVAPAFDDRPLQVCGQDGDPMRVWTAQDGRRAMTGEARWDAQP